MRRAVAGGLLTFMVAAALPFLVAGESADAGDTSSNSTVPPPATLVAGVTLPPSGSSGSGGSAPVEVPCVWLDLPADQAYVDVLNAVSEFVADVLAPMNGYFGAIAIEFYERFGVLHKAGDAGEWLKAQRADCRRATAPGGVTHGEWRWVPSVPPDPATLVPGTWRRVTEVVAPPVAAMNPAGPGFVKLGMWLAVEDAGPYVARAQLPVAGPALVWAESTATLAQTSFEFGPGGSLGSVTCPGAGVKIPDHALDDVAEGPCGFTFTDFVGHTTVTISSEWTVSWALSDGRSGVEPVPLVLSTVVPYEVREIQTVGVANP